MSGFLSTSKLLGTLAECHYKDYCDKYGWAYISLEQIHERGEIKKDILKFKKGFNRIYVKLPKEIIPEIKEISKPSNASTFKPSYVYDFLACKVGKGKKLEALNVKEKKDFSWVEVKGGRSPLRPNQLDTALKIKIPLIICRVPNIRVYPNKIKVYWNTVEEDLTIQDRISERDILV